jgi:transcriptional regulator GlxA family with amidase domain
MIRILFLLSMAFACQQAQTNKQLTINPVAVGQSFNAGFLIIDGVYNSELIAPYDIFQHTIFHTEGGIEVFTVAQEKDTVTTFEGINILADYGFDSPDLPEIDILIVPSAEHNMDTDLENDALIKWVAKTGAKADYVISLCDGAFILAKSGLVNGKESTTFPGDIQRYKERFPALTVHENVSFVHHDNLLTSAGGAKSYDVAIYLVHHLFGEKVARGLAKGLVIDWDLNDYMFVIVE